MKVFGQEDKNDLEIDEIWEDSMNSDEDSSERQEAKSEVEQLVATALNPRKFTRKVKEINLNLTYADNRDKKQLTNQLEQVQKLMAEIVRNFAETQKQKFEEKEEKVRAQVQETFEVQIQELSEIQGKLRFTF